MALDEAQIKVLLPKVLSQTKDLPPQEGVASLPLIAGLKKIYRDWLTALLTVLSDCLQAELPQFSSAQVFMFTAVNLALASRTNAAFRT